MHSYSPALARVTGITRRVETWRSEVDPLVVMTTPSPGKGKILFLAFGMGGASEVRALLS